MNPDGWFTVDVLISSDNLSREPVEPTSADASFSPSTPISVGAEGIGIDGELLDSALAEGKDGDWIMSGT